MPRGPHKQLKLYADASIPKPVIDELRAAGLVVDSATESGLDSHPDEKHPSTCEEIGPGHLDDG